MAKITGLRNIERRLARIPKAARAAVKPALDKSADELVAAQRSLAPLDDGTLKASIKWHESGELTRTVRAGGPTTTRPVRSGTSATYDYALAQEFGTTKMSANPFFWPGYRLLRKRIRNRIKRAISKAVKEEFGGGK